MSPQEFIKNQSFRTFFIRLIDTPIFLVISSALFPTGYGSRSRTQIIFIGISIREILNYMVRLLFAIIIESNGDMVLTIIRGR